MNIEEKIKEILYLENPGLLPDEAEEELKAILYGKDIYMKAFLCLKK